MDEKREKERKRNKEKRKQKEQTVGLPTALYISG